MAYDPGRGRVLLFGGTDRLLTHSDTWEWDGTNWNQLLPATSPPARFGSALAYDSSRGRIVMTGDFAGRPETWEWTGTDWLQRATTSSPWPPRWSSGLAYDSARARLVLFGGYRAGTESSLGGTFEYGPTTPATWSAFGAGCPGSGGAPALSAAGRPPWLGAPFSVQITNHPPATRILGILGSSKHSWMGLFPLPLDLRPFGMPGCTLHASGQIVVVVPSQPGPSTWTVALPATPDFLGGAFYQQAIVFDPTANAVGLTMTNAGEGRFGGT
jgi:hypothetical protein